MIKKIDTTKDLALLEKLELQSDDLSETIEELRALGYEIKIKDGSYSGNKLSIEVRYRVLDIS